jgi:predicted GNAT family acetyltransferase
VLNEWARAFVAEAIPGDPNVDVRSMVERMIEAQQLLVWENGGLVSMAAATRPTPNGCSISFVYTPTAQRSRGYASACVAELSQRLLDSGKSFCALFTDLANPTSNGIYQRIGYQPGGDFREIRFVAR